MWREVDGTTLPDEKKTARIIYVDQITSIEQGRTTKNFERFKRPDKENVSFSIVAKTRDLDLEAPNEAEKHLFIHHLQVIL